MRISYIRFIFITILIFLMESKIFPDLAVTPKPTALPPLDEDVIPNRGSERKQSIKNGARYLKAPRIVFKGHTKTVISLGVLKSPTEVDTLILSGSEDKTLRVWSLATGQLITTLSGHKQRLSGIVGYADGENCPPLAVSASWDETLRIWPLQSCFGSTSVDPQDIMEKSIPLTGFRNRVLGIAAVCQPGGVPSVAGCSADNTIQVYRLPDGERLYVLEDKEEVTWNMCLASWFIPEAPNRKLYGPVLLSGTKTNIVRIWRAKTPRLNETGSAKPDKVIRGAHTSAVSKIGCFDYDDQPHLVTICRDLDIRIFSMLSGDHLKTLRGHKNTITDISAHDISTKRGGAIIVSSSSTGNIRVWKYSTGELMRTFNGHTEEILGVASFQTPEPDKDDLIIVSGSKDNSVRTWLFAEEKNLKVLGHRTDANRRDSSAANPKSKVCKPVRVNAIDVYTMDSNCWIVTGADDGALRLWSITQGDVDSRDDLQWTVSAAHKLQIVTVVFLAATSNSSSKVPFLNQVLIISGCREGRIRISSLTNGEKVCPMWEAHSSAVTSLSVFPGRPAIMGNNGAFSTPIEPFLVSGSEDNTAKVWALTAEGNACRHVLEGHEFDVTAVAVFMPRPPEKVTPKERIRSRAVSRVGSRAPSPREGDNDRAALYLAAEPMIITASVDNAVCLWSSSTGEMIEVLDDSKTFVTSLAVLEPKPLVAGNATQPMLAAGNGNGNILVWSLRAPYRLLHTFSGHTDEVVALSTMDAEGLFPVLVSGSLDTTMRVWDVRRLQYKSTIEGHTDDVMAVKVFRAGDNDPALASGSSDSTVRVLYDFLGSVPNYDVVMQQFKFDLEGVNSHIQMDNPNGDWPRIAQLVKREGANSFFGLYYCLFGMALRASRPDFIATFLPLTTLGLLKSNSEMEDGDSMDGRGGLLRQAIDLKDTIAVRTIVDCWCAFLTTPPTSDTDLIYNKEHGQISMDDMLRLAEHCPKEFEQLICSVKLVPAKGNTLPNRGIYMFNNHTGRTQTAKYVDPAAISHHGSSSPSHKRSAKQRAATASDSAVKYKPGSAAAAAEAAVAAALKAPEGGAPVIAATSSNTDLAERARSLLESFEHVIEDVLEDDEGNPLKIERQQGKGQTFLFLPLNGAVHMEMIKAYTTVCGELDSVDIFNSEAGQLALSYAWHTFGIKAHLTKFAIYVLYVAIATTSTLTFDALHDKGGGLWYISIILIGLQLLLNCSFVYSESKQYMTGIIEYLEDIWNFIDFTVIMTSTAANVLRLVYWDDTPASIILLSFASVFMWFNILYFLRAFEATGPLVSMIMKISDDMKYLIFVVLLVLVGFSQAFWLVSREDSELPFGKLDNSLLNSFSFMLGGYDPEGFAGAKLESFALFLSTIYMLIVSILLLNLLIALMGDSYGAVKEKGLAQWRLEQAEIITEMQGSMSEADRTSNAVVYFRKKTEDIRKEGDGDDDAENPTAALTATLEERCDNIEEALNELRDGQQQLFKLAEELLKRLPASGATSEITG